MHFNMYPSKCCGVAELCVTDKKDVIVVSIVLPHSNDDNSVYDDGSLMRARYQV